MSDRAFDRLAQRIRPDEDIANRRALREIVSNDATIMVSERGRVSVSST